jgi:hypothetical protein
MRSGPSQTSTRYERVQFLLAVISALMVLRALHEELRGNNPAINPTGSNLLLSRIYWLLPVPRESSKSRVQARLKGDESDDRRRAHAIPILRLHPPLRPSPPLRPPYLGHVLFLLGRPSPRRRGGGGTLASAHDPRGRRSAPLPPLRLRQPPRPVPPVPCPRVEPPRRDHLRRVRTVASLRQAPARVPPLPRRRRRRSRLGLRRRSRAPSRRPGSRTLGTVFLSRSICSAHLRRDFVLFQLKNTNVVCGWDLVRFRMCLETSTELEMNHAHMLGSQE